MTSAEMAKSGLGENQPVALPELISALTFALDLTEGETPGHGLRCCLLGMRLAAAIGLPQEQLTPLYYALQVKDVGCSNNAARMTAVVGGDDRAVKAVAKRADWTSVVRSSDPRTIRELWKLSLPGESVLAKAGRLASLAVHQRSNNREMIELRCERGSEIVRKLEMGEAAAEAVLRLDEHWDGGGYPGGLSGEAIPVLSRICAVAQCLDVFATVDGEETAIAVLRARSGRWFDPTLVEAAAGLHRAGMLWEYCGAADAVHETRRAVMELEPTISKPLGVERIDTICEAFAEVVDAKSPFTYRHSVRVAEIAQGMAERLELRPERQRLVRRAGLLHDLGKLSIPNTILDKKGPLTTEEWTVMMEHPRLSRSVLERVTAFREMAAVAGEHHEMLDGMGYPDGLKAKDISVESRVLAIADRFAGMTERRSYDLGYAPEDALKLLRKNIPHKLDAMCFAALEERVLGGGLVGMRAQEPVAVELAAAV